MDVDLTVIARLIVGALANGALGGAVYQLLELMRRRWPQMLEWPTLLTRPVGVAISAVVVAPVYAVCVAMLWLTQPSDWRGWLATWGTYTLATYVVSQGWHAKARDRFVAEVKDKLGVDPVAETIDLTKQLEVVKEIEAEVAANPEPPTS